MSAPTHASLCKRRRCLDADKQEVAPGTQRENSGRLGARLCERRRNSRGPWKQRSTIAATLPSRCKNGTQVEGYIFDRVSRDARRFLRPPDSSKFPISVEVPYSEIAALAFTGRDTAAGKSWEAWLRKYWEKKRPAKRASLLTPKISIKPTKLYNRSVISPRILAVVLLAAGEAVWGQQGKAAHRFARCATGQARNVPASITSGERGAAESRGR